MKYFVLYLLLSSSVSAQIRPRRSADESALKQVTMYGQVREITERGIALELKDSRIVTFKITASTRFNNSLTLKSLQPGDRLTIQGTQDAEAFLIAQIVSIDAEAAPVSARRDPAPDSRDTNTVVRKPAAADPDDNGPPVLRRGPPAPRTNAAPVQAASRPADELPSDSSLKGVRDRPTGDYPTGDYTAARSAASRPVNSDPKEALIERAREYALNFTENLPNYVCQQYTTRFVRVPGSRDWKAQDVVSANVVYENGKEDYRNVAINGKPVNKKMEELPGSWSTGEFGTTLRSLFHPGRQAEFKYVKQSTTNGLPTWVYDYKVRRENSDWRISLGAQSIIPAYGGRVWIEEKTGQVLRIEMSATDIPQEFPLDQVEASNDYGFVRLATVEQYMLPTHAETLSCERGSPICSRNTIDFRNYHKYSGEANISFDK